MENLTPEWDARQKADRQVVIAGETFRYRAGVAPEEVLALPELPEKPTVLEQFQQLDALITLFLEEEDAERWHDLRTRKDAPLTGLDVSLISDRLLALASGRPPTKHESSLPSPETNGKTSTEDSSTEQVVVSPTST